MLKLKQKIKPILFASYKGVWRAQHKGTSSRCNICDKAYSEFAPFGVHRRKNAMCPNCESVERHRLQWEYMSRETNIKKDELWVMHFAPEVSIGGKLRGMENIHYVSSDLYDPRVDVIADITNMPFKDNSFDVVLCNHVLEHIVDDIRAMKEIYRILKPGGWAILQVPLDYARKDTYEDATIVMPDDRLKHFDQKDHVRIYGTDYEKRLKSAGLKVEKIKYAKKLKKDFVEQHVLDQEEVIYLCTK